MSLLAIIMSLLGLSLVLLLGLISLIRNLVGEDGHGEPVFQDSAPTSNDDASEHHEARSQFAWQSRSHFRGPD